jgi:hypothetical protein
VHNGGIVNATGLALTDTLLATVTFGSATPGTLAGGFAPGRTITFILLAPGDPTCTTAVCNPGRHRKQRQRRLQHLARLRHHRRRHLALDRQLQRRRQQQPGHQRLRGRDNHRDVNGRVVQMYKVRFDRGRPGLAYASRRR